MLKNTGEIEVSYKELLLDRDSLGELISKFMEERGLTIKEGAIQAGNKKRVEFGKAGAEFAKVDLHLVANGTTTVQWKLGKNQELGEELANYLKDSTDPDQARNVTFTLNGIISEEISPVFEQVSEDEDFSLSIRSENEKQINVVISSNKNQDHISVTHYRTTDKLLIQGKPLSSYRFFIYLLSELLDMSGLEKVLWRKDQDSSEVARPEFAISHLKGKLTCDLDGLPQKVQDLLISGCCVKLAAPQLPEYSMLLFPDLRALEGLLRKKLADYGMLVGEAEYGFGDFFDPSCKLLEKHVETIDSPDVVQALNNGYSFLRRHRNTLFHMEDFTDGSRVIDTLDKALALADDCYQLIGNIDS